VKKKAGGRVSGVKEEKEKTRGQKGDASSRTRGGEMTPFPRTRRGTQLRERERGVAGGGVRGHLRVGEEKSENWNGRASQDEYVEEKELVQ